MHLTETRVCGEQWASMRPTNERSTGRGRPLRVLWLHDTARRIGGCEQYMVRSANLLRLRGIRSTLLYGESGSGPLEMLSEFDESFPIVDLSAQLASIRPDVIYAHRIAGCATLNALQSSGFPTLRFFHDHKLFCPREHKYTVLTRTTCTRTVGAGCYACLGVITRSERWPGVRLQTVRALQQEQAAHHGLSGYVVASQYMANHLADHGFEPGKIHVLPLFADTPAESEPVPRDRNLLLFVGQIVRGKGLDLLLHALGSTPASVRLAVVGTGAQEDEVKQQCQRLGLASRVSFMGKQSQHQLADFYRRAGCLVVPSRSPETFGQVGVEAMSYGLPAIASAVGGIPQWLRHNENGLLCDPQDASSFARAIIRLVEDSTFADSLSLRARELYVRHFQPQAHMDSLESLLRATAGLAEVVR